MTKLTQCGDYRWRLEMTGKMRVPGIVYTDKRGLDLIKKDKSLEQVMNVAHLPGIVRNSLAMPDIHWGYGFPIGGVAAMDADEGVVSPGGVGYDINCGVRLAVTNLDREDLVPRAEDVANTLFSSIPCGVGVGGNLNLNRMEIREVLEQGARWVVKRGFGSRADLEMTEEKGRLSSADPDAVGRRAIERGRNQLGTLGSGNHFLEVGFVESIFDEDAADVFGLRQNAVTFMIHSGSRGLGHQVCSDFLQVMQTEVGRSGIDLPDRQLACVPVRSSAGERYLAAMAAAANYGWANRQYLLHLARGAIARIFPGIDLRLLYDVSHNIARMETHNVKGKQRDLCVHRKGATRAFPPGHPVVPERYRDVGQPVLIPGDMGTGSYILTGTEKAMKETFGSACHGAGRMRSRSEAKRIIRLDDLEKELADAGVIFKARSRKTLVEEAPAAYKCVDDVVNVVHGAGIARKVARLKPVVVIKG